jgi:repressor LexA
MRDRLLSGLPPTVREVKEAFGFRAVQTAREHLEGLVEEGRLSKEKGKARGYRLPAGSGLGEPARLVPLLGRVPAGPLNLATEDLEGHITIQSHYPARELFGLRVQGESMTGAGILPGDIVVVRRQPTADPGDIVVALIGEEATVKRLRIRRSRVELHSENPAFEPIIPDPGELTLLGKVVEVRRYLERP